jgi:hypothetical protein
MFLPKNGISETERELQTAVLRGMGFRNIFSKASWGGVHRFPRGFQKFICSCHLASEQLLNIAARGFREIDQTAKALSKG